MLSAPTEYDMNHPVLQALNVVCCDSHHHGATAAAFQGTVGIPFVATTKGVSLRVRVCACLCAILNRNGRLQPTPSADFQKHPSAQYTDTPTATNGTTSSEPRIRSYTCHVYGGSSVSLLNLRHARDFKSTASLRS